MEFSITDQEDEDTLCLLKHDSSKLFFDLYTEPIVEKNNVLKSIPSKKVNISTQTKNYPTIPFPPKTKIRRLSKKHYQLEE